MSGLVTIGGVAMRRNASAVADESLQYLRALGDPDRLHIVQILRVEPKSVGDICRVLRRPIANVSHHLGILKDAGMVSAVKRGRFVIYRLNHAVEAADAKGHILDFGCCRVEFAERKRASARAGSSPNVNDQALLILNRILGQMPSAKSPSMTGAKRRVHGARSRQIKIVNPSFENPSTAFFDTAVDGWTKEGDPACTGVFRNFPDDTPLPGSRMIRNADGVQLATVAAQNPGTRGGGAPGLFQELATAYRAGASYVLSLDVGVSSVQPPRASGKRAKPPALRFALTYMDPAGRRRELVSRTVAAGELVTPEQLAHFSVATAVPAARPAHPCVGRRIGVLITAADNAATHSGHFIADAVSLAVAAGSAEQRSASRPLSQRSNVR